jgi:hypothetical protein
MMPSSTAGYVTRRAGRARFALIAAGAIAGLLVGCTSIHQLPPEAIPESGMGHARVVMRDGYAYGFERILARGDSLIGIYHVSEERVVENNDIAFVDLEHRTVLRRGEVERVEIRRLDASKTLLLGAGAVISGAWLVSLFQSDAKPADEGGKGGSTP